ncbi:MAG: hypothetical protein A2845_05235 [Candidatus Lloydbacteria bacterium RIFCSPHIGHO2_01_FULL_49_22]|uniref:Uncharacterized protein n=1 Tax=Candidatus Lloydbacteria bacterium RIFCSPHIGHO2_01_FULL_49_22 TaxID=1798658 RepID=A0A1G2CTG0_9BACT|nr:MAG: hypothetical protein A2845_05235 [Candidatus Lloydbacteria bacterium RIFCSPHIGHO2_01_FULL_49_22]OGZ09172.1 MAG: hypothetical protein A3C14_04280 [Candidatus Lloydbacteria bacterium RIFCSPHIGHO2_02_FULL_50_18]
MENVFVKLGPSIVINVSEIREIIAMAPEPIFNQKDLDEQRKNGGKKPDPESFEYFIRVCYKNIRDPEYYSCKNDEEKRDRVIAEIYEKMGLS